MIKRINRNKIEVITSIVIDDITEHDRDEMAIPTYMHKNPLIRWLMWKRYDCLAKMLDQQGDAALEFGCGIGLFLSELDKHYTHVFALDLYPQYAMKLCDLNGTNVAFLTSLDQVDNESLDVIIAADVLEHIENLNKYLILFDKKLKPGGKFLLSGPTESLLYKLGRFIAGFNDKADYHHTNIYDLIESTEQFGFKKGNIINLPFWFLPPLFKLCAFKKVN